MLCVTLQKLQRACGSVSGGISDFCFFDPYDFDFTNTTTNGIVSPYSAIARRTVGSGAAGTAVTSSNTVTSVTISNGGTGYTLPPIVSFTGGGGTGATATATVVNGIVTGITVTAPGTGYTTAPTVVFTAATNTGKVFPVSFLQDEAEWKTTQSVKGCSVKYDHEWDILLPDRSHTITSFLSSLDAAACCCGLGIIFRLNNGKIFVAGEKYVNGTEQPRFTINQNGSTATSGKLIDDSNGVTAVFKGSYTRDLYEYSGTWSDIQALTF